MITRKSIQLLPLTRELAAKIAAMPGLPGERERKAKRLSFLANHLRNRSFLSPTWDIAIDKETGNEYRVDGQHTSYLLSRLPDEDFPFGLNVALTIWEIDSLREDGAKLFDIFNNPAATRDKTDIIKQFLCWYPDVEDLERRFCVAVGNAINFYRKDMRKWESDPTKWLPTFSERAYGNYFNDLDTRQFALWLERWTDSKNAWMYKAPAVASEIFTKWMEAPEKATAFWGDVFTEGNGEVTHITRQLANKLNSVKTSRAVKSKPDSYRTAIRKAWLAFLQAEEMEAWASKEAPSDERRKR